MAQNKDEMAELKLKTTLCVNNCGLPGNPTTNNMCNSCYKASVTINDPVASCSEQDQSWPCPASEQPQLVERGEGKAAAAEGVVVVDEEEGEKEEGGKRGKVDEARVRAVNRCAGCRRKVGLTGFRCRCGDLFCAQHRYSDRHACCFDYKAAGREQIARENPVFKAPKILRF